MSIIKGENGPVFEVGKTIMFARLFQTGAKVVREDNTRWIGETRTNSPVSFLRTLMDLFSHPALDVCLPDKQVTRDPCEWTFGTFSFEFVQDMC